MKITIGLWTYRQKADGTYPLKIKTFEQIDGKKIERYYPIGIDLEIRQWDKKNKVVKSHPLAADYNLKILETMQKMQKQNIKGLAVNVKTAEIGESFIKYYDHFLESVVKPKYSVEYYNSLRAPYNKLKSYYPTLQFKDITRDFLKQYEVKLIGISNSKLTIHDNFKRIKFVYKEASKDGLTLGLINPFLEFKVRVGANKKKRLTYEEVAKIEALELVEYSKLWHARNYWLFSFYCAGIRVSDVIRMQKSNIKNDRLIYLMNKSANNDTPTHRNIKLMPQALAILSYYKRFKGRYLFSIVDEIPADKFQERDIISRATSRINKQLKKLTELIECDVKLSFHISRHSFADYCKNKGLDVHLIKDLLGHSKVTTTEIYMKSFYKEETDEAMDKLFG